MKRDLGKTAALRVRHGNFPERTRVPPQPEAPRGDLKSRAVGYWVVTVVEVACSALEAFVLAMWSAPRPVATAGLLGSGGAAGWRSVLASRRPVPELRATVHHSAPPIAEPCGGHRVRTHGDAGASSGMILRGLGPVPKRFEVSQTMSPFVRTSVGGSGGRLIAADAHAAIGAPPPSR